MYFSFSLQFWATFCCSHVERSSNFNDLLVEKIHPLPRKVSLFLGKVLVFFLSFSLSFLYHTVFNPTTIECGPLCTMQSISWKWPHLNFLRFPQVDVRIYGGWAWGRENLGKLLHFQSSALNSSLSALMFFQYLWFHMILSTDSNAVGSLPSPERPGFYESCCW